ncbi:hypothetical protein DFH07DRAFT_443140 [Mycena maculata]|uniref:Uncharacterized protein n=1 Tax=Mycena maculata TaxID=230809 RepID=A0AAD7J9K3_9AGAR|nr:hypothetical protein DFH07DRAFT_443140 [Mycena maculata]
MTQTSSSNENTKLLSPSPPPLVNQASRPNRNSSLSGGANMMSTFRNVYQLVHGVGENVRGTVLGAIDDWENSGERKHHDIAQQGKAEMDEAYRRLWGTTGTPSSSTVPRPEPTGYTTGYDAAPPTYQATGVAGNGYTHIVLLTPNVLWNILHLTQQALADSVTRLDHVLARVNETHDEIWLAMYDCTLAADFTTWGS